MEAPPGRIREGASHLASADSARTDRPVDGYAFEQASEGRAQPAQRHPRLVDADRRRLARTTARASAGRHGSPPR
jgi:hypothetical protein